MKRGLSISSGFSLVEALLSMAVFMFLATGLIFALIYFKDGPVISGHRAQAVALAQENLAAVDNLAEDSFSNLTDGTWGLATTGNQWNLSGSSSTVDIFNSHIDIATIDSNHKSATATVTWQEGSLTKSFSLNRLLTNWRLTMAALGGLLIYGDSTTSTKFRTYDTTLDVFSTENAIDFNASGNTFIIRTSPKTNEAIAGFVTSAGVLNIMCYDGTSWSSEWTTSVGGNGSTRRFDIAYETNSGDVMVLYSNNVANNNEMAYRTKLGADGCGNSNWSGAINLSAARTTGIVQWVKMAWDRRAGQDLITAIWADANSDLSAMIWSGTAWGNEPAAVTEANLERSAASQDVESFDVEYESISGDVMLVWGRQTTSNGVNGVRYRVCTGGTAACVWGAVTTPPTFSDDATNLDISANPNTDQLVFASIGNQQSDLQIGYWSGSVWTNTANRDTSAAVPLAGTKLVSTGWLISDAMTRSIVVYNDNSATNVGYYVGNLGAFTAQTDFTPSPIFANPQKFYQIEMNPLNYNQLMFCLSDNASDLFCKRLSMSATPIFTWTNSDVSALELTLPQSINSPYSFAFYRY